MLAQLCMLASLLATFAWATARVLLDIPYRLAQAAALAPRRRGSTPDAAAAGSCGAVFYEGEVAHERRRPVRNVFRYPVRMALIDLDAPPPWFLSQAGGFISADEARRLAGTDGRVRLLTNPVTAGYTQNPISVYYCSNSNSNPEVCIAEVTNTPWGARVAFLFSPKGEAVPKALHVSPFMDMANTWHLKTSMEGDRLSLSVLASHPQHGAYFSAVLTLRRSDRPHARSEEAGLAKLLRYGYQPQRDALLIYWQAVKLLWKGATFFSPPPPAYRERLESEARHPRMVGGRAFRWQGAKAYPWNVDQ